MNSSSIRLRTPVVILEYAVHGTVLRTGLEYNNHFISVITVEGRKIVHWRDYMDFIRRHGGVDKKEYLKRGGQAEYMIEILLNYAKTILGDKVFCLLVIVRQCMRNLVSKL